MIDLSVIVPVYNSDKYIADCIESILSQKNKNIELICVDDGSTDNSYEILKQYEADHKDVIRVYRTGHRGVSSARNYGLENAKGKYVYYVDSDDVLTDNTLEHIYECCVKNDLDVLFFSFENFTDEDAMKAKYSKMLQGKKKRSHSVDYVTNGKDLFIKFVEWGEYYVTVWCQCIKRSFAMNHQLLFEEGFLFEDQLYTFRVLENAKRTMCIDKVLYKKRIRSCSICTCEDKRDYFVGTIHNVFFLEKYIKMHPQSEYTRCIIELVRDSKRKVYEKLVDNEHSVYCTYLDTIFEQIENELEKDASIAPLISVYVPTFDTGAPGCELLAGINDEELKSSFVHAFLLDEGI